MALSVERVKQPPAVQSIDGQTYTRAFEDGLNELAVGTFGSPPGSRFLEYLESLTLRRALLPDATDAQLRHLEGARWLVGIIRGRISLGRAYKELP